MACHMGSTLLFAMVLVYASAGPNQREVSMDTFNLTAEAQTVYLVRRIEDTGILNGIKAVVTSQRDFSLQIWTPMNLHSEHIGRDPGGDGISRFSLTHSKTIRGASMDIDDKYVDLSFSKWLGGEEARVHEYCPYVYRGDFVGLMSLEDDLPIHYKEYNQIHPRTWSHRLEDPMSHLQTPVILNFNQSQTFFDMLEPNVKSAQPPEPPFRTTVVPCHRASRERNNQNDRRTESTASTAEVVTESMTSTTSQPKLPSSRVSPNYSAQVPKDMYIAIGAISAVAVIAVVGAMAVCLKSHCKKKKGEVFTPKEMSTVPVYSRTIHASTRLDPRLSTRNPVYGDDVRFLRSVSTTDSQDGAISYILVPASGVLPPGESGQYEEVRFMRQNSRSAAEHDVESNTKTTKKSKPHTYLGLVSDDDSGVMDLASISRSPSGSSSGQESPVHSPISREPSGPYCKIDE